MVEQNLPSRDFFISYNKADRAWAEWVAWELEEAGYTVVIQAWDFRPGSNFVVEMDRASKQAQRTIGILSPDYVSAMFTQSEWSAAFVVDPTGTMGKLLPVIVRECNPEGLLTPIVHIDLVELKEAQAKKTLLEGVQRRRVKPQVKPKFPGTVKRSVANQPRFPGPQETPKSEDSGNPGVLSSIELPETVHNQGTVGVPASPPSGTMSVQSSLYVERGKADETALRLIKNQGITICIQAPGQTGGSSLLRRMMGAARDVGKEVVEIDFTKAFDDTDLTDREAFHQRFCAVLANRLNIPDRMASLWKKELSIGDRCTGYTKYILEHINRPLVLAMDEIDRLLDTDFRSSFFAMLRAWHNDRYVDEHFEKLDLVLVTSLEPHQLIDDPNQSPFNVGEVIELPDFTALETQELNERYGLHLNPAQLSRLTSVIEGHPYLWQLALYQIAARTCDFEELLHNACEDDGPFGRHLTAWYSWLRAREKLRTAFVEILRHGDPDEQAFFVLRKKGLAVRKGGTVVPRCPLYNSYLRRRFDVR